MAVFGKKTSKSRLFIQLHILVYALLLVFWAISYFNDGRGTSAIENMGIAPKNLSEQRRARVVSPKSPSEVPEKAEAQH